MKLANAAASFDTTVATDAYNSSVSFLCQIEPQVLFKIDGVAVRKRAMSAAPSVVLPLRGVVVIDGEKYLIGVGTPDMFKGKPIRRNYVIQGADTQAQLTSIAAELAGTARTAVWSALVFNRYLPESADSSKYPPQYQIFLAGSESAPQDSIALIGTQWYLIKDSYISESGLRIALANEIRGTVFETVNVGSKVYDPLTDTYSGSSVSTKIMRVRWQEHFVYLSKGQIDYVRGDEQVFILKSAMTQKPADTLTLSDGTWQVLDVQDEGLVWSCHVRR